MNKNKFIRLTIISVLILALCLLTASCGRERTEDTSSSETQSTATAETNEKADAEKKAAEEKAAAEKKTEEEKARAEEAKRAEEEKAAEEAKKKEDDSSDAGNSKSSKKSTSKSKSKTKEKQMYWVEPVYEIRTVTPDTGTRYCCGANSGGGCGASWHGTKDDTYNSWKSHWQNYVKKRTEEEAAKGNTYVCDHIHDDSRWEPDPAYTEKFLVREGYWKELD